jgi:hypothetical protein
MSINARYSETGSPLRFDGYSLIKEIVAKAIAPTLQTFSHK